jgi:N-acetylglucosamine kinase-like BadF-type ATPase
VTGRTAGRVVLGLDLGGSSSRARLSEDGRQVAEAVGEGANVSTVDPGLVEARLAGLIAQVREPRPVACCAGAAGSEFAAGKRLLERLLARFLPGIKVLVVHDARLILAAAGADSGIALIAGTGSVAYGRDADGEEARAGGWGWMLGDEGGGAWVVREAVRVLMRRRDAGEPMGALGEALFAATGTDDALELAGKLQGDHLAGHWAANAHVVFEMINRDRAAVEIADRAADALAALVEQVRSRLAIDGPVVMAGGLLLNFPALSARVLSRIGNGSLLSEAPVAGAVRLAEQL